MRLFMSFQNMMPYGRVNTDGEVVLATGYALVRDDGNLQFLFEDDGIEPGKNDIIMREGDFSFWNK